MDLIEANWLKRVHANIMRAEEAIEQARQVIEAAYKAAWSADEAWHMGTMDPQLYRALERARALQEVSYDIMTVIMRAQEIAEEYRISEAKNE